MIFLPTYEECLEICKNNNSTIFYETIQNIDGYDISIFNYRIADYINFTNPVPGKNIDARELRGLTFVKNIDGSIYKRFLHLHKFWNLNQVPETTISLVENYKIKKITNKEDGSLLTFIELPNKKILPKTKNSINNDQTIIVKNLMNDNLLNFIRYCFDNNINPIFELVSFRNRVVLNYTDEKLILLHLRNLETGEYLELKNFENILKQYNLNIVPEEKHDNIFNLITLSKEIKDKEGWVIEFDNGLWIKLKTTQYLNLHHLLTENLQRENDIIEMILEEKIDDAISQLDPKTDFNKIQWIQDIQKYIYNYINKIVNEVSFAINDVDFSKDDVEYKKKMAIKYKKHPHFHFIMNCLDGKNIYTVIKEFLLFKTSRLENARKFLENIKNNK